MTPALLLLLLFATPAQAQEPPACTAARAGSVSCQSGRLCECRFERGGSITGTRDGHRWDCSVLRPSCGPVAPADINRPAMPPTMIQPIVPWERRK